MSRSVLIIFALFLTADGRGKVFDFIPCYEKAVDQRMPLNLDNFVGILEQFEDKNYNTNPEDVADAILARYRKNGVIFIPTGPPSYNWAAQQESETVKQDIDDKLITPNLQIPDGTLYPREECSLHLMVSHSTDYYDHAGTDYIWNNRPGIPQEYSSSYNSKSVTSNRNYDDEELAEHPIEHGVVQTTYGPIALGIILSAIMEMSSPSSKTVKEIIGIEEVSEYMDDRMQNKRINSLYGVTLSGELAQEAILKHIDKDNSDIKVGPTGLFGNSTACPRIFSLKDPDISFMSRAEIYAAVDALIISEVINTGSSQKYKLTDLLRMYYGDHGLFHRDIRACNRFNNFKRLNSQKIKDEALNYMYAYQHYFDIPQHFVSTNEFDDVESQFKDAVDDAYRAVENFLSGSSYEDQTVTCNLHSSQRDELFAETVVDLVVIFTPTGDKDDIQKQLDYIGLTARQIGVGYYQSRVAVLNGITNRWESPMTNHSNIADWVCNFTTYGDYGSGSSQNYQNILTELDRFYAAHYSLLLQSDEHSTGAHSQVIMWNLPKAASGDREEILEAWTKFNSSYPDVSLILVGSDEKIASQLIANDPYVEVKDFFVSNNKEYALEIAYDIVQLVRKAPRMFIFPGCNNTDSEDDDDDNEYNNNNIERSHIYTSYITPNFTTFIKIPPQYFRYSELLKLKFEDDVSVCISRSTHTPVIFDDSTKSNCTDDTSSAIELKELCGYNITECLPIFIGVTGNSKSRQYCSDKECRFPHQIEFQMTHEGMICGSWSLLSSSPIYLITILTAIRVLLSYF